MSLVWAAFSPSSISRGAGQVIESHKIGAITSLGMIINNAKEGAVLR